LLKNDFHRVTGDLSRMPFAAIRGQPGKTR